MPNEEIDLLTGDWKSRATVAPAPIRRREPAWHAETKRPRRLYHVRVTCAAIFLLLLFGGFVWACTWLQPPRPSTLVLLGARYEDNLEVPLNVYGWQGLEDLAAISQKRGIFSFWGRHLLQLQHEPLLVASDTDWEQGLRDIDASTIVMFLALHGGSDGEGAYLLPQDARPEEKHRRLRLREVLERMARLPEDQYKVLILDATQIEADWQFGMLHNNFARELRELNERIVEIPRLVVLSASDIEQRSWTSDEWRRTIFAHYLIEGCRGGADDLDHNGRIDLWELFAYVRDAVQRWTAANRGAAQRPVLLPEGDVGRERARRIDMAVLRSDYQPPDPHATEVFSPPTELLQAWQRYQAMASDSPSPTVYTPYLWSEYQERMLRYEQLLRCGDQQAAARHATTLRTLELKIEQAKVVQLGSLGNTLTMPVAAGMPYALDSSKQGASAPLQDALDRLWQAPSQEYAKRWGALQTGVGGLTGTPLRLALSDLLLQRAAVDPAENFAKALALLDVLHDPVHPRPAEIHFAVMLRRDMAGELSTPEFAELVALALDVRRLAEHAALCVPSSGYSYSAQVLPWIEADLKEADQNRRYGEDLVFGPQANWAQAKQYLQAAQQHYQRALQAGQIVQQAFAARDLVLDRLPYYSQWWARRALRSSAVGGEPSASLDHMESLWAATHYLADMLESPGATLISASGADDSSQPKQRSLAEQAATVRGGFDSLAQRLEQSWQELESVDLPSVWREVDDALLIPGQDPQLRMRLITNKRRTSRRLLIESAAQTGPVPKIDEREQRLQAMDNARCQGRLALAALGQRWFDQCKPAGGETYDQVAHRLQVFEVESEWWNSLTVAGGQIALRWQMLFGEVATLVNKSKQQNEPEALGSLQAADRFCRQMPGTRKCDDAVAASDDYRRLSLQSLLCQQVERTLADHWYADQPDAEPYFQSASSVYLTDAEAMSVHRDDIEPLKQRLANPGGLAFEPVSDIHLTTEQRLQVPYRLRATPKTALPPGFPVAWVEVGDALALQFPDAGQRFIREYGQGGGTSAGDVDCTIASPVLAEAEKQPPAKLKTQKTSITVHALYRGQRVTVTTPVTLHLRPDTTVVHQPLPDRAGLAVRADAQLHQQFGEGSGAVAIVLDCSGSMGPGLNQPFTARTKYAEATAALRTVLQKLPPGTKLSLWVFGQAMGNEKTVADPEQTIIRIQDPVAWDPKDDNLLHQLMSRIEHPALEPWNESPIMAAILAAKADLDGATGFKTLLVLTDGMDNRFAQDPKLNPKKVGIPAKLREAFENSGIVVNVIGFKVEDHEQAQAEKQFASVSSLAPPGRYVTVDEAGQLAAALDTAMRQRLHFWLDDFENRPLPGVPREGLQVSKNGANDRWLPGGLEPGSYKLRTLLNQPIEGYLALGRADMLLLKLTTGSTAPQFERVLYAKETFPWRPGIDISGWYCSVLQNQRLQGDALQMLVTLEKTPSQAENWLQVLKPRETWIEVVPPSASAQPGPVTWGYLPGYPAPAWRVDASHWAVASDSGKLLSPKLRVWWNPDQDPPYVSTLDRGSDYTTFDDLRGRVIQVPGGDVRIEDVQVEDHQVETSPGVREKQTCLVVRLSHAPGRPILAHPGGLKSAGQEHRFYTGVGRYSGMFWPVAPDVRKDAIASLSFVSLDLFKREAEKRGFALEFDSLPTPEPNDVRPRPPQASK